MSDEVVAYMTGERGKAAPTSVEDVEEAVRKENDTTNTNMNTNIESEATVPILDLEIQDIEGVGPTTAKKLKAQRSFQLTLTLQRKARLLS